MDVDGARQRQQDDPYFIEVREEIGIPPLDVVRWATRFGAESVGCGEELGTLEVGKLADLLVVDGDPIADITCLKDPANVPAIVKGGVFHRDALGVGAQRREQP